MSTYRHTVRCCYLGMFVQAIVVNLSPVLFIPFREQLGLSFEQLGRLILINFVTQVSFDLLAGAAVSRVGIRPLVVAAHALASMGLLAFGWLPGLLPHPYLGLLLGTVLFSAGAGMLELLLSPIINAVPSDRKDADMSLLHSFYAWGQMTVILLTALAIYLLRGVRFPWQGIATAWALVPAAGVIGFLRVPMPPFVEEARRHSLASLVRTPAFLGLMLALGLAGAAEIAISQWISAYSEKALHLPKLMGDLGGVCLFGAMLGVGRTWFGVVGHRVSIHAYMLVGSAAATALYVVAALCPWPWVSLAACALAGLAVSLLWPGVLSLSAARFPLAGVSMFAVLAASGDMGCAFAPWLVGLVADGVGASPLRLFGWTGESLGLRAGLLVATAFPLALTLLLPLLRAPTQARHAPLPAPVRSFLFPRFTRRFALRLVLVAAATWLVGSRVLVPVRIHGISMEPTYHDGTFGLCSRLRYLFREPRRGDVVGVRFAGPHAMLAKRIVALAGETVAFQDGVLLVNAAPQHEPYIVFPCDWNMPPRLVETGHVYVVGDNRSMAIEDHVFGQAERKRVIGGIL